MTDITEKGGGGKKMTNITEREGGEKMTDTSERENIIDKSKKEERK